MNTQLTQEQGDRARGLLLGTAIGDALGAPLEFGGVVQYPTQIAMTGGGTHGGTPGQWTDDTAMAVIIAQSAAAHGGFTTAALDAMALGFSEWERTAPDVGIQTRHVISQARTAGMSGAAITAAAVEFAANNSRADGNGSLMRTAPVVLPYLVTSDGMVQAVRAVSSLTHASTDSVDACILWCAGMRSAVLSGTVASARAGMIDALQYLEATRRPVWADLIAAAEAAEPWDFPKNGWVVHAFQAAWSAVTCTRDHADAPSTAFTRGVDHAVRCGFDTDTVGAIAGMMLGAIHGYSAMPTAWTSVVHGWPGLSATDLLALSDALVGVAA